MFDNELLNTFLRFWASFDISTNLPKLKMISIHFLSVCSQKSTRFVYIFHITPNFASNQLTLSSCLLYLRNQYQGILSKSEITKNQNKEISTIKKWKWNIKVVENQPDMENNV